MVWGTVTKLKKRKFDMHMCDGDGQYCKLGKGPSIKNVSVQSIGEIMNGGQMTTSISMKIWNH